MGSAPLISPELTSDSSTSTEKWIADAACDFVAQICRPRSSSENITNHDDCLNRLQDEMNKIDAFKRELPLCMLLLRNAITRLKHEVVLLKKSNSGPVLEEFLPLKKSIDEKIEDVVMEKNNRDEKIGDVVIEKNSRDEKMNWLSSVQLWSSGSRNHQSPPDSTNNKMKKNKKGSECCNDFGFNESKDEVGGSTLLSLCTTATSTQVKHLKQETNSVTKSSSSRSGDTCATNVKFNSKSSQTARKQRRCWSPELHRRFVNALQKLGGAQAATPKQIRDHMQVDGLTNDEVKSHLQKYRLHARRVPPPMANSNRNTTSTTFVGGFMMSKQQCSDTAASIEEEDNISEIHNQ